MGAITATTVATAASLASAGAKTGMSIAQASKARRARDEADREAQRLLEETERQMEINPFDAIAIQKEPYEMAFDAAVEAAATESQALAEADPRLLAGLAGRRRIGQEEALQGVRASMGQQMLGLEQASAAEDARLRDQRTGLLMNQATAQTEESDLQDIMRMRAASHAALSGGEFLSEGLKLLPLSKAEKEGADTFDFTGDMSNSTDLATQRTRDLINQGIQGQSNQMGGFGGGTSSLSDAGLDLLRRILENRSR